MEGVLFEGTEETGVFKTYIPELPPKNPPKRDEAMSSVLSEYERRKLPASDPRHIPTFFEWATSPLRGAWDKVASVPKTLAWGFLIFALVIGVLFILGTRFARSVEAV